MATATLRAACLATVRRIEVPGLPRWHLLDEMRRDRLELLARALPELAPDDRIAALVVRGTGLTLRAV